MLNLSLKRIFKMLIAFSLTLVFTMMLSPILKEMSVPIYEGQIENLIKLFLPPFMLIAVTLFLAYRFQVLDAAGAGHAIPVIIGCWNYLQKLDVVQTEGMIFILALAPGGLVYFILKIIDLQKNSVAKSNV